MIFKMRDDLLLIGLPEKEFWDMTVSEIERYVNTYKQQMEVKRKETASNIHTLGLLVGLGVASKFSSKVKYPTLYESFPALFSEQIETNNINKSVINFLNFAHAHNKKMGDNIDG